MDHLERIKPYDLHEFVGLKVMYSSLDNMLEIKELRPISNYTICSYFETEFKLSTPTS